MFEMKIFHIVESLFKEKNYQLYCQGNRGFLFEMEVN